ncbi:hypothetical protein F4560_006740 [Saccharothrix ecbatanensis]|uniref:Uncharacterized protein n=1 Tax=Saccharothrix ecbatanensis TaxID=1105145 RepID=A0A7W9HR57_9PSEU|nr:hypothetical protein [Saccharothrix ecbatanensis]
MNPAVAERGEEPTDPGDVERHAAHRTEESRASDSRGGRFAVRSLPRFGVRHPIGPGWEV